MANCHLVKLYIEDLCGNASFSEFCSDEQNVTNVCCRGNQRSVCYFCPVQMLTEFAQIAHPGLVQKGGI